VAASSSSSSSIRHGCVAVVHVVSL
jgi:hypothetical protein